MLELLTRFVVAVETIAKGLSNPVQQCSCDKPEKEVVQESSSEKTLEGEVDYESLKHSTLKKMCLDRGIEAPKQTKAPTLRKLLIEWDLLNPGGVVPTHIEKTQSDTGGDPFDTSSGDEGEEEEEDPFGASEEDTPAITKDSVQAKLQELQLAFGDKNKGNAVIKEILLKYGKVKKFKELGESSYVAVYSATLDALTPFKEPTS